MSNAIRIRNLSEVPAATAAVLINRRQKRQQIVNDPRWSQEYRRELLTQADQDAREALENLNAQAKEAAEKVRASIAKPADGRTTEERVLAELTAERKFRQISRRLDAGHDPLQIARELANAGDREALRVMREELPSVLAARGQRETAINGALMFLDAVEAPLRSDQERANRETAAQLDRAEAFATTAYNHAVFELEGGQVVTVLPQVDGSVVKVGE